ncbi:unnamed protein product [Mytilus edulis]|uniref:Uncharacterized protein n=1 Tax=Mytilus edulis TaxID=6550 RepID=A0A8S3PRA3_MYTED|nr:unnamed protein product [Mytilus edulis]
MMGQLDRQKTISPNINTSTINTKLMMKNNNTMEWLGGKNEEDKIQIMAKARQESQILKEKEISDEIKLNNERRATLQQRIDEKEAKCIKINQERKELLNEIDKMGGKWKSEPEMTSYIDNLKFKKDKISAIKNQIMYRKDVCMQSVTDKSLFRRNLDINSLKQNLINLIQLENTQNVPVPMEINENDNKHSHEQDIPLFLPASTSAPLHSPSIAFSSTIDPHIHESLSTETSSSTCTRSTFPKSQTVLPSVSTIHQSTSVLTSTIHQSPSVLPSATASSLMTHSPSNVKAKCHSSPSLSPSPAKTVSPHELLENPPCWFKNKYLLHTWDEGSNKLTTYNGKIVHYLARRKTFRVNKIS